MSEQSEQPLRRALDEIDRLRKRGVAISRFLLFMSIAFMFPTYAIFLLRGNVALGIPFALVTLWAAIFGCAINLAATSWANTQRILRAIEALSRERPKE